MVKWKLPEHLKRHKLVFDRHQAGETYVSIAKDLGVTTGRARVLAERYAREMRRLLTPNLAVTLPIELWEYAEVLGGGDWSKGVRLALEYYRSSHSPELQ